MSRVVILSPHLDDAVFSAGDMLNDQDNALVLTLFSGIPEDKVVTEYDRSTGFENSNIAMIKRREEDAKAVTNLGAAFKHLDLLDKQYNTKYSIDQLISNIKEYLDEADIIYIPLGMLHQDHIDTRNAALKYMNSNKEKQYYFYEDLPYRVIYPDYAKQVLDEILQDYNSKVLLMTPRKLTNNKVYSVNCYRSQMNTGDISPYTVLVPERHWRIFHA